MISTIVAAWNIYRMIHKARKEMEADVEAYLTEERARAWRLEAEAIFMTLANGEESEDFKLPKPIKWFFAHTEADNRLGQFGQHFLKSNKLDIYRTH